MPTNRRHQNTHGEYRLEHADGIYGCYASWPHDLVRWFREKGLYYRLWRGKHWWMRDEENGV